MAANPERFPLSGRLAKAIKTAKRSAKGPAQHQSRRNRRKARQEKRQGFAKRRRAEKRENVAAHNAARESVERDMAEMEEAYQTQMARLTELSEKDQLTAEELQEMLSLSGAPPAIIEAAGKVVNRTGQIIHGDAEPPKLIVPGQ